MWEKAILNEVILTNKNVMENKYLRIRYTTGI